MSWFKRFLQQESLDQQEFDRRGGEIVADGWDSVPENLQEAIATLMNYALNTPREGGGHGVRHVGEEMHLCLNGTECGTAENPEDVRVLGDYEIVIRRVR